MQCYNYVVLFVLQFALESHLKLHGYDPATSLVEVNSRQVRLNVMKLK